MRRPFHGRQCASCPGRVSVPARPGGGIHGVVLRSLLDPEAPRTRDRNGTSRLDRGEVWDELSYRSRRRRAIRRNPSRAMPENANQAAAGSGTEATVISTEKLPTLFQ